MATIGAGVSLKGYYFEDSIFTMVLASGITTSDIGKAMAQDTGAANKAKLAGDGDVIIGRLESVENRVQEGVLVGAVALRFLNTLPVKSGLSGGDVVSVGKFLVGAGSGEVKGVAAADVPPSSAPIRVWATETGFAVAEKV